MIVKLKQDTTKKDIEVQIEYAHKTQDVDRLVSLIKAVDTRIKCHTDNREIWIHASEIYYMESVDKKTFVYCENDVYRTEFRLYQLLDNLAQAGFVQINKASILNIHMLDGIKPLLNSRMEATLNNGERLYVTRKYLQDIKKILKEGS